jgi:hypothetical protein
MLLGQLHSDLDGRLVRTFMLYYLGARYADIGVEGCEATSYRLPVR